MVDENTVAAGLDQGIVARLQRAVLAFSRHWLAWVNLLWGILIGLPWLAPIMMHAGATRWARAIYAFYGLLCHQLANRSFFLFGPQWMYPYNALLPYAVNADTLPGLRAFIGNPELGYKVAWSDRMVSFYGGLFLGGIIFALVRRWVKSLKWVRALLLIAPMVLDGGTHMLSDLGGVARGFRYDNAWLAYMTGHTFSSTFYAGNALGSFNSWMRLITGLLAGLAITWAVYPLLNDALQ